MRPNLTLYVTCLAALVTLGGHAAEVPPGPTDAAGSEPDYAFATRGARCYGPDCAYKILLDASNLGSDEAELAELTFEAGYEGQGHPHGSMEIFYVLAGRFGHEVNGTPHILEPGMVGVVKPGDMVRHSVPGQEPARVLVIWVPGGEAGRIFDPAGGTPVK